MPSLAVDVSANGDNQLIAAVANSKIVVLGYHLIASGAVSAKFTNGAAGSELTGVQAIAANGGLVAPVVPPAMGGYQIGWFETTPGVALVLNLSSGVQIGGVLVYKIVPVT
jgi:hypothetical protein